MTSYYILAHIARLVASRRPDGVKKRSVCSKPRRSLVASRHPDGAKSAARLTLVGPSFPAGACQLVGKTYAQRSHVNEPPQAAVAPARKLGPTSCAAFQRRRDDG